MTPAESINPAGPAAEIDLSQLPSGAIDNRSPAWWGNTLLLLIESSMFAVAIATYFYFRRNFDAWPPPRVNVSPPVYDTAPRLGLATFNLALMLISLVPMFLADRGCVVMNERQVRVSSTTSVAIGAALVALRFLEFRGLVFRWDENAYASVVWTLMGLHLMHLMLMTLEDSYMTLWLWTRGLDDKHARDVRITAIYWYWVVAVWVVLYVVIYWVPRLT